MATSRFVTPTSDVLVELLVDTWSATSVLLADLDEATWKSPSGLPGWTVQDVLSHLIGTERFLEGHPGAPDPGLEFDYVKNPIGEFNEFEVQARRELPGADVLAEWNDLWRQREATLRGADDAYFAAPAETPVGPGTTADFLAVRVLDSWIHEQDLRRCLDHPGRLDVPAAAHTIDRLLVGLPMVVGKRAHWPEGPLLRIVIDRGVERTIDLALTDGRAGVVDTADEPAATITMSTSAFLALATGRTTFAELAAASPNEVTIAADDEELAPIATAVVEQLNVMM